jgi:hypothetical protein
VSEEERERERDMKNNKPIKWWPHRDQITPAKLFRRASSGTESEACCCSWKFIIYKERYYYCFASREREKQKTRQRAEQQNSGRGAGILIDARPTQ